MVKHCCPKFGQKGWSRILSKDFANNISKFLVKLFVQNYLGQVLCQTPNQQKNLKYSLVLEKTSKSCQSPKCQGVIKLSQNIGCEVSKLFSQGNLDISTDKNWKYCFLLEKMPKNCERVQLQWVQKLSQKYGLWGVWTFASL